MGGGGLSRRKRERFEIGMNEFPCDFVGIAKDIKVENGI
jgi:hypothetical protein